MVLWKDVVCSKKKHLCNVYCKFRSIIQYLAIYLINIVWEAAKVSIYLKKISGKAKKKNPQALDYYRKDVITFTVW